jgi:hypothetical protein
MEKDYNSYKGKSISDLKNGVFFSNSDKKIKIALKKRVEGKNSGKK